MKPTIALLALSLFANAAEVKIAWDVAPEKNVTGWRVYRIQGATRTLITTVNTPTATVTAEPEEILGVTAFNSDGLESQPSTLTLPETFPTPPSTPTGLRVVEIQTSSNLKDWEPLAFVPLKDADKSARFIRAQITEIPQP